MTKPDASVVTYDYQANSVTQYDERQKPIERIYDASGRLTSVTEQNENGVMNVITDYTYDVLDNLIQVNQGVQSRTFMHDSLSRLVLSDNPESGQVSYGYDNNGNLTSRTDARNTITTYTYDALNRVLTKTYTEGLETSPTEDVTHTYDGQGVQNPVNSIGRLSTVSNIVSNVLASTRYSAYDVMGRVTASAQETGGITYEFHYTYDQAGSLKSQTYPSGRTVSYSYDPAGRVSSVSGLLAGQTKPYAQEFTYEATGVIQSMLLGNGLYEQRRYNNRLQPKQIGIGQLLSTPGTLDTGHCNRLLLSYEYGTSGENNGNISQQTIDRPGTSFTETYLYDNMNRLDSVQEAGTWTQDYHYDTCGNRWVTGTVPDPVLTPDDISDYDPYTNRLDACDYDDAGNMTMDQRGRTFAYDAENRQTRFNTNTGLYEYDGEGKRVKTTVSGQETIFVYDAFGKLVAEYSTNPRPSSTLYVTADYLGSTRLLTDSSGGFVEGFDYYPFGEPLRPGADNPIVRQKFTGKERDNESGLDFFGARYYSGPQGRFTSPDIPLLSRVDSPQMWNLYAYTANNPLKRVDPDGRNWFEVNGSWTWYDGANVDQNGNPCKRGTKGCMPSDYTHLIVFEKTGTNKYGAATGTLTLYGKGYTDKIAESAAFSGGAPGKGPVPEGTFTIRLRIRETMDASDISQTSQGPILNAYYGIQEIPANVGGYDVRWEWGKIRARLNEARGESRPDFLGNYLHGKMRPGDYTHVCIAERSEQILKLLLQMDPKLTPAVPVDVRRK